MTIRATIAQAKRHLQQADVPDAEHDAWQLLAHVCQREALMLRVAQDETLSPAQVDAFLRLIALRAQRIPLQHLEGRAWFMGRAFHVSPDVLIPRQDTEVLCEEALRRLPPGGRVIEIGTGSGILAITLALEQPDAQVVALDISEPALAIARGNARRLGAKVDFLKSDCFSAVPSAKVHLILSNPPYISAEEMRELMPEVRQDPELALYGGVDGLDFYRRITKEAPEHLLDGGVLLFEIGWTQKEAVSALVRQALGNSFALRDWSGHWRVVGGVKP